MIQDQTATRFALVCIAEYLSISESKKLLAQLKKFNIVTSHVVVNQLVKQDAILSEGELQLFKAVVEDDGSNQSKEMKSLKPILKRSLKASQLTSSRNAIQQKYLKDLKRHV